ncbi:MAG: hypothetical protein Q8L05_02485 [Actinomycetota bacterium]|nr:hypothetical protein [Actinomycetota bacterium]MDP2288283.1 hypothetical protein [Actinomycetota bacterium]
MPSASEVPVLRTAGLATLVVGLVSIVLAGIFRGKDGLIGALVATVLVLLFFGIGNLVLNWALRAHPQIALSIALLTYVVKIGVLFVLIIAFANTTLFNTKVFALVVVICTITWTLAEVVLWSRSRVLYVEPGTGP